MRHSFPGTQAEKKAGTALKGYAGRITAAYEEERKRIARDLHDGVSSTMLLLINRLDMLARDTDLKETADKIASARAYAVEALEAVRRTAQGLRPRILDDLGLSAAIEWLAEELEKETGTVVSVVTSGEIPALSPDAQINLYRIVQEALNNIQKHADADKAEIRLGTKNGDFSLEITDDGKGFEMPEDITGAEPAGRLGMAGMMERAALLGGTFKIESAPGKGTNLEIRVPVKK